MRQERLNFGLFFRIGLSLLPIVFGMPTVAMIMCSYNIAISFLLCGPMTSLVSALFSVCISMFFFGTFGEAAKVQGLFLAIESILCAGACIYSVLKGKNFFLGVWLTSLGFLLPSFMSVKYEATQAGQSVAQYLTDTPVKLLKEQMQLLFAQNNMDIDLSAIEKLMESVQSVIVGIIPTILVLSSVVIGYIVMWVVCLHQRKVAGGVYSSFSMISAPRSLVAVMVVALMLAFSGISSAVGYVALNIFLIMLGICYFAGMSVVDYFLRKKIRKSVPRVILHILIIMFFSPVAQASPFINLFTAYALLGIIDSFARFRKVERSEYVKEELDETKE